jgi:hypothetical protein
MLRTISSSMLLISLAIDIYDTTNSSFYSSTIYPCFWIIGVMFANGLAKISNTSNSFLFLIMATCGDLLCNYCIAFFMYDIWCVLFIVAVGGAIELVVRNTSNVVIKRYIAQDLQKQAYSLYSSSRNIGAAFAGLVLLFFSHVDLIKQALFINFLILSITLILYCVLALHLKVYSLSHVDQNNYYIPHKSISLFNIFQVLTVNNHIIRSNIYYNFISALLFAVHHVLRILIPSQIFVGMHECAALIQISSTSSLIMSAVLVTKSSIHYKLQLWQCCMLESVIILGLCFSTNILVSYILYFIFIFLLNIIALNSFAEIMSQAATEVAGYASSFLNSVGILIVVVFVPVISYAVDYAHYQIVLIIVSAVILLCALIMRLLDKRELRLIRISRL